jgi:zinc and cadmium transporter
VNTLAWVLVSTALISLTAWVGVLTLYLSEDRLEDVLLLLVALAAGALIGGAFLHLLPRAIAEAGTTDTVPLFLWLLAGFCTFYVLEAFIGWHHHHAATHEHEPVTYLVLLSDALHNFIDGLVIAGSFLVSVPVGLVTTLAIALHEVPQEIGDYGVLVHGGFDRRRALVLNYLTQVTVVLGGAVGIATAGLIDGLPAALLPFAAGNFLYIASSDLVPEIKRADSQRRSLVHFTVFLCGIVLMLGVRFLRGALG